MFAPRFPCAPVQRHGPIFPSERICKATYRADFPSGYTPSRSAVPFPRSKDSNETQRFSHLCLEETAIDAVRPCDEFGVASILDDAAPLKHENAIEALHRRKPVRNNDRRAPGRQMRDSIADEGF